MPPVDAPAAPMPLFERLEDDAPFASAETPAHRTLTPAGLRASVRGELIRLLNTRRGRTGAPRPLDVLHYGLQDWSASDAARAADRHGLERAVVEAILAFEPRLKQPRVQLEPEPDAPWRLRLRIMGTLEVGAGPWAVAFVAQLADGHPVGVVDERIA
ncbi:type VI secretion system lysozyme-like protein [Paraburkholderia sp. EB58]|jgi:type VI secretion system lysozyme-like protein|uniref:type VI secretion system baseplate subunit TssE n=1 Tax=Paraburkholderia sp. EB58 TaxID=3035125 RepID=UPI003D2198B8